MSERIGPLRAFLQASAPERPDSPPESYGVPRQGGQMVEWQFVVDSLRSARTYWVATVNDDGTPHAAPIWGVFVDDDLYLETAPFTLKARNMARRPAVSVHVELGDHAVIVEGQAIDVRPRPELGAALALAFRGKYDGYDPAADSWDEGSLYRVVPRKVLAWRDMPTATRWNFPRRRA